MKNLMNSLTIGKPLLILLFANFLASPGLSQNIKTTKLVWETDQVINLENQTSSVYNAKFKTNASQSMEWIQKKGQMNTLYEIARMEGSWEDISTQGTISYLLTRNGKSINMIIEKNSSGTFITMDFIVPGQLPSRQKFHVQSIKPEN